MSDPRHQRVKEIFLSALELEREARASYLDRVCAGDPELRAEVDSLLDEGETDTKLFTPLFAEAAELGARALAERFEPAARVAGRYVVRRRLGAGGMGEVYLARDERLDVDVALKFLPPVLAGAERSMELLLSEARLARGITHPGVCRVYDVGELDGEPFITMEYIEGVDLSTFLRRSGLLERAEVRRMSAELCAALSAAHAQGVLHRDLKPSNVLVDRAGRLHVTDFGLAGNVGESRRTYPAGGSPAYMAPELLRGEPPSVQSDLFGLGLVLFELAGRRRAFQNARAILEAADAGLPPPAPPRGVDPVLERVLQRTLASAPADRPRSAAALEAALSEPDDLVALLRLGELPSPELVAASGARGLLDRRGVGRVLALLLAALAVFVPLAARVLPVQRAAPELSPAAYAARAEGLLAELLPERATVDRAWAYTGGEVLEPVEGEGERYRLHAPASARTDLLFWYRQASRPLVPRRAYTLFYGSGRVQPADPPLDTPGVDTVVLDLDGRLVLFASRERRPADVAAGAEPDWRPLFALAGLDPADFAPAAPGLSLPSAGDRRASFRARPGAAVPEGTRVEAASQAGRPSLFAVLEREPSEALAWRSERLAELSARLYDTLLTGLIAFAIIAGWRNLRSGRGDPWGALRLAVAVLCLRLAGWLVRASHVPEVSEETTMLILGIARGLFDALLVWGSYMGVEPLVRRHWPRVLVSASRLLRGRVRDPLVASHVLLGVFFGALLGLARELDAALADRLGGGLDPAVPGHLLLSLTGFGGWAAVLLEDAVSALTNTLIPLALLVVLRALVRNRGAAIALAVLLIGAVDTLASNDPAIGWLTIGLGQVLVGYLVLVRFGALPWAVALYVQYLLEDFPVTTDLGAWYAGATPFALAVVLGLAALAALEARRAPAPAASPGRP